MTFDRTPFVVLEGLKHWLQVFGGLAGAIFAMTILVAVGVYGASGPVAVMARVRQCLADLLSSSPRRIWAIARLTIQEAVRRKALFVFVVFAVLIMFAGWFLESDLRVDLQVKNAVSFALTTVSWLTIPVVLMLSCWSLPEDIRLRSLHTVVTKPVRRGEIVMGRILGFSVVSTTIVAAMGIVGYVWVLRQVPGDAELVCRVPVYGTLAFLDREGQPTDKGVNTGDIWEFRSYIEGGTKAAAVFTFPVGSSVDRLRLESRFEAFRTHKGKMGQSLLVRYVLINPTKQLRVPLETFEINEFGLNERTVENELTFYDESTKSNRTVLLSEHLIDQEQLSIEVQCMDSGQYLGMARPDLFIRLPDKPFAIGYFKAVLGVMLLAAFVVCLGVTSSTFVKGPVATLVTFSIFVIGQGFREFMLRLISGEQQGGGPFEAWYRLLTHKNDTIGLPEDALTFVIQKLDAVMLGGLWIVKHIIPDLSPFSMSPYVANGFDVPWSVAVAPCVATVLGYLIPCFLVGYYSLTLRELEAK